MIKLSVPSRILLTAILFSLAGTFSTPSFANKIAKLYNTHCAECHHPQRLGSMGPALLPGNLKRLRRKAAIEVITNGRAATQMPAFVEKLSKNDIKALTDYIFSPVEKQPIWGLVEINASHIIHNKLADLHN